VNLLINEELTGVVLCCLQADDVEKSDEEETAGNTQEVRKKLMLVAMHVVVLKSDW
jgi:hypothetical protein